MKEESNRNRKAGQPIRISSSYCCLFDVLLYVRTVSYHYSHRCGFAPRTGHEFICETSHVLLAGVSGGFSPGTPVFAPPTD